MLPTSLSFYLFHCIQLKSFILLSFTFVTNITAAPDCLLRGTKENTLHLGRVHESTKIDCLLQNSNKVSIKSNISWCRELRPCKEYWAHQGWQCECTYINKFSTEYTLESTSRSGLLSEYKERWLAADHLGGCKSVYWNKENHVAGMVEHMFNTVVGSSWRVAWCVRESLVNRWRGSHWATTDRYAA